jgi:hypothetical protein
MNKIWEWLISTALKKKSLIPLLLCIAFCVAAFSTTRTVLHDPTLIETARNPLFLAICILALATAAVTSLALAGLPDSKPYRLALQSFLVCGALFGIGLLAKRSLRDSASFEVHVVMLGEPQLNYSALTDVFNRLPSGKFKVRLFDHRRERVTSENDITAFMARRDQWRVAPQNDAAFFATVCIVDIPVGGNWFGYAYPGQNIAVMTTHEWPTNGPRPSVYEYVINQVFAWSLYCGSRPTTNLVDFHPFGQDSFCLYDASQEKDTIDSQITNPRLCAVHGEKIRAFYGPSLTDSFSQVIKMDWLKTPAVRKALQQQHGIALSGGQ